MNGLYISQMISKNGFRLIWMLVLSGCLSPIEFAVDNIGNRLVVSGQVSPIADQNYIQVGRTAATERLPIPVVGAHIQLFDDLGNVYVYSDDEFKAGSYLLPDFVGIPSRTYHIMVVTPEGETYMSEPERMPESIGQVTSYFGYTNEEVTDNEGIITEQPFVKIYTNNILPSSSETNFIKWHIEEAYLLSPTDFPDPFGNVPPPCFIVQNADPQMITLFNGEEVKTESVNDLLVASRIIDWSFLERHYFTIYQSSITKEAHEYWRKVNILANQVGSIFDTPPAEITGNMRNVNNSSEKVLGYFQASNQTFERTYLLKTDLPFRLTVRSCIYDNRNFQEYPARCLDCTNVSNSSYRRPDWF